MAPQWMAHIWSYARTISLFVLIVGLRIVKSLIKEHHMNALCKLQTSVNVSGLG